MLAGVVAAGMFNDGNVNPGRLKAPTVMLAGVVAAGMRKMPKPMAFGRFCVCSRYRSTVKVGSGLPVFQCLSSACASSR